MVLPFLEGIVAGFAIAIPIGAIAILIINLAIREGFCSGFWAGAGAASADLTYATLAAVAGQALTPWLTPISGPLRVISGLVLIGMAGYGFWHSLLSTPEAKIIPTAFTGGRIYIQFLGLTLLNPLTITYFASLILGGGSTSLITIPARGAFVIGAGLASLFWQTLLALFGALAHRSLNSNAQKLLSTLGHLIVLCLGARLLISF